jgi:hypothetical protein
MIRGLTGGIMHLAICSCPIVSLLPMLTNSGRLHYAFWTSVTDFESCALRALVAEEVEGGCGLCH